ncbi:hypothetical protein [Streptomyces sp. STCH 565 A]|uniref:hypothetical protein n=1 Tax=Streptomyces sp. STCH 565 A TaxID=2950532 RepID=UPI0020753221|nr:hypothetical protein [Streptomyces sp. STCH 565 A]MCM8548945.1 hypothetical protein [Streptomyces sp. STCH 565 A]
MRIDNTEDPSSTHATGLLALAVAMGGGSPGEAIEAQEKAGQSQLVHSDQLPTTMHNDQAAFEALGFTFGDADASDPLFRPATLPDGWKREASDHSMWSHIVDDLGRRRVSIFYKAAFYDRRADMGLVTVESYVSACQYDGADVITDDTWATPSAVVKAAEHRATLADETTATWEGHDGDRAAQWAEEARAEARAYRAIAAQHASA